MVLLVMFVIRHNLTSEALENLLSIIAALLPASSILPSSVSRFKKYFTNLKHPFVFHHYCSFCFSYISQRGVKQCTNSHCLKDLSAKGATSYFIEIPIVDQLKQCFQDPAFIMTCSTGLIARSKHRKTSKTFMMGGYTDP